MTICVFANLLNVVRCFDNGEQVKRRRSIDVAVVSSYLSEISVLLPSYSVYLFSFFSSFC